MQTVWGDIMTHDEIVSKLKDELAYWLAELDREMHNHGLCYIDGRIAATARVLQWLEGADVPDVVLGSCPKCGKINYLRTDTLLCPACRRKVSDIRDWEGI